MSRRFQKQYADQKGAIQEIPGIGIIEAAGAGSPTGGLAGYAKGCNYLDYTNGANYVNGGDSTSATWVRLLSAGGGTGVKMVGGTIALDGTNPTPVTTGLTTVLAAVVALEGAVTPGVGTSVLTVDPSGYATGVLNIYAWKVTSNANPTLIASTGTETVDWLAWGL